MSERIEEDLQNSTISNNSLLIAQVAVQCLAREGIKMETQDSDLNLLNCTLETKSFKTIINLKDQDDLLILLEGDLVGRHTKKSVGIGSCMGGAGMLKVDPIEKQLLCESKCQFVKIPLQTILNVLGQQSAIIIKQLCLSEQLNKLGESDLQYISSFTKTLSFGYNDWVICQGNSLTHAYILLSGKFDLYEREKETKPQENEDTQNDQSQHEFNFIGSLRPMKKMKEFITQGDLIGAEYQFDQLSPYGLKCKNNEGGQLLCIQLDILNEILLKNEIPETPLKCPLIQNINSEREIDQPEGKQVQLHNNYPNNQSPSPPRIRYIQNGRSSSMDLANTSYANTKLTKQNTSQNLKKTLTRQDSSYLSQSQISFESPLINHPHKSPKKNIIIDPLSLPISCRFDYIKHQQAYLVAKEAQKTCTILSPEVLISQYKKQLDTASSEFCSSMEATAYKSISKQMKEQLSPLICFQIQKKISKLDKFEKQCNDQLGNQHIYAIHGQDLGQYNQKGILGRQQKDQQYSNDSSSSHQISTSENKNNQNTANSGYFSHRNNESPRQTTQISSPIHQTHQTVSSPVNGKTSQRGQASPLSAWSIATEPQGNAQKHQSQYEIPHGFTPRNTLSSSRLIRKASQQFSTTAAATPAIFPQKYKDILHDQVETLRNQISNSQLLLHSQRNYTDMEKIIVNSASFSSNQNTMSPLHKNRTILMQKKGSSSGKKESPFYSNHTLEILPQKATAFSQHGYADEDSPIKARRQISQQFITTLSDRSSSQGNIISETTLKNTENLQESKIIQQNPYSHRKILKTIAPQGSTFTEQLQKTTLKFAQVDKRASFGCLNPPSLSPTKKMLAISPTKKMNTEPEINSNSKLQQQKGNTYYFTPTLSRFGSRAGGQEQNSEMNKSSKQQLKIMNPRLVNGKSVSSGLQISGMLRAVENSSKAQQDLLMSNEKQNLDNYQIKSDLRMNSNSNNNNNNSDTGGMKNQLRSIGLSHSRVVQNTR